MQKRRFCGAFDLFDLKTGRATGADRRMLSLRTRQSQYSLALRAFAIDVSLAVAKSVFSELEEVTELLILTSSFLNIF